MMLLRLAPALLAVFLLLSVPASLRAERRPETLTELVELAKRLGYVRIPPIEGALVADERTEERLCEEMRAYFCENAPGIEKDVIGLKQLTRGFARVLVATKGELSESLFNERVSRYNDTFLPLSGFIDSRRLDPAYAELVKDHYGARILAAPSGDISLMREVDRILAIPAGCTPVTTRKGEYFRELVQKHYPGIEALGDRQRAKVYDFIASINPVFVRTGTKNYGEYELHEYRVTDGMALLPPPPFLDALAACRT